MNEVAVVSPDAPRAPGWVRLVIVSDTHNVDLPVALFPPGDLLIHAGGAAAKKTAPPPGSGTAP